MGFLRQSIISLLLLTNVFVNALVSLTPFDYNITQYLSSLPEDLRPQAEQALRTEWNFAHARRWDSGVQCDGGTEEDLSACPPSAYRYPTAECNNFRHKHWGARGAPFLRMLPPKYSDNSTQPRLSVGTHALPSVLEIAKVFSSQKPDHMFVTPLLAAWGEFIMRDLVATEHPQTVDCCSTNDSSKMHGECFSKLAANICVQYTRSVPTIQASSCDFKYREQMNLATSFLDGSDLYGSTDERMRLLRTYDGGLVNVEACERCKLNLFYRILLKEHNRVAIRLGRLNRHWTDEKLFYEARKVVAAQIQHITYNEFLTTAIGEAAMTKSELKPLNYGFFSGYSSSLKAGIYNGVALSALPIFMSMIPAALATENITRDNLYELIELSLHSNAHSPGLQSNPQNDYMGPILIHMARDHGIASYPHWMNICSEETLNKDHAKITFDDLSKMGILKEDIKKLKLLYSTVNDVDLLPAALLEQHSPGAVLGPTFSCMLQRQFSLLRLTDRFWYENDFPPTSLSLKQVTEIRKSTVAHLLCNNVDGLVKVQPKAFVQEDEYLNAPILCDQYLKMDFSPWYDAEKPSEVTDEMIQEALSKAEQDIADRRKKEYESWLMNGGIDPKSSAGTAASFSKANKAALNQANVSLLFEFATNEIINSLHNRRRKRQAFDNNILSQSFSNDFDNLQNVDVGTLLPSVTTFLQVEPRCDDSKKPCDPSSPFRTLSGYCNNLRNPSLGASLTTFARLLPPVYDDGISKPRKTGVTGQPLPSPRVISSMVHPDISHLHNRYTLFVMQYAQFLDHDLTMTPIHKGFHESIPNCKSCDSWRTVHPECHPIPIPPHDNYYPEFNITNGERVCLPFMRSLPGQKHLGPREQVNQNTAFLDGSQIYGENSCVLNDIKGPSGLMNITKSPHHGKDLMPLSPVHPECKSPSGYCFIAGDGRASEQPGLTAIHTVHMREHNRLVDGLRRVNPHWNEHLLFEHARRIHIAELQHVTYNEFLPRVLSWNAVNLYGLKLLNQGYYREYNPSCNPSVVNEFAAAAYRIGHSMLRPHIPRMSHNYQVVDPPILLRDGFFKIDMFMQHPGLTDEIMRGLISTPMESMDQFITGEVTNHLFEDRRIPFSGVDLISLNIQRGRDHGIPSYNNYRALCNLKRATTFEDLAREIPMEVVNRFKRIYATVDDIDLFPGGMSERPLQGGLVGPTLACIIALQFRQSRKCDRFWYENDDPTVRFTEQQLAEIRKSTFSRILCDNMEVEGEIQRAAFDLPSSFLNPRVPCHSIPAIDLNAWRELPGAQSGCSIANKHIKVGESAFPSPCMSCVCTNEGTQCASLRVTNCEQLLREWSRESILRDDICTAQCGYLLHDSTSSSSGADAGSFATARDFSDHLVPPPLTHVRRNVRQRHITNTFVPGGFKFPDLTRFMV